MAITIRGTTPAVGTSATATVSVSLTGTLQPQAGDVLDIVHGNDFYTLGAMPTPTVGGSSTGVTAITGTGLPVDGGTDQGHIKRWYYVVTSTGDATVSVTETGAGDEEKWLVVRVLSGVDNANPIDAAAGNFSTVAQATAVCPAVTATGSDSFLVCDVHSGATGGAHTGTTGSMSEDYDTNPLSFCHIYGGSEQLASSGSTGTRTFTPSASEPWFASTVAYKAGSAAAPAELGGPWFTSPFTEMPFSEGRAPWEMRPQQPPIPLAVWTNTPVLNQSVSLDDTAAAADALTVAAAAPLADTAAAADDLTVAAAVPLADTAAGADSLSTTAAVPLADTAGAADSLTVGAAVPLSDTATATDAATVAAAVPLDDTASAADSATVTVAVSLADTATADDQLTVTSDQTSPGGTWVVSPFTDMPFLASVAMPVWANQNPDVSGDQAISLSDDAAASDTLTVAAAVPLAEAASASDTLASSAAVPLSDTAAGDDAVTVAAAVPLADTAVADDALIVTFDTVGSPWLPSPFAETPFGEATPWETGLSQPPIPLTVWANPGVAGDQNVALVDTAAGADALTVTAAVSLAETATAADALTVAVAVALADSASAVDAISIPEAPVFTVAPSRVSTGSQGSRGSTGAEHYRASTRSAGSRASTAVEGYRVSTGGATTRIGE